MLTHINRRANPLHFSDPYHERYGQHLTQSEVYELIAPHDESIELVDDWLASYGIFEDNFERSAAQDWVKLKIPIGVAEQMLNTVSVQSESCETIF